MNSNRPQKTLMWSLLASAWLLSGSWKVPAVSYAASKARDCGARACHFLSKKRGGCAGFSNRTMRKSAKAASERRLEIVRRSKPGCNVTEGGASIRGARSFENRRQNVIAHELLDPDFKSFLIPGAEAWTLVTLPAIRERVHATFKSREQALVH